jgi:hypothetical protein
MDIKNLIETHEQELLSRNKKILGQWKPYIDIVEKYNKSIGKGLEEYEKANIAQCCNNLIEMAMAKKHGGMISEATFSDAIAFARQMLPTIPALLPSLVSDHVAVVQAIDRPQAQVYYMNIKAGTAKGSVSVDDTIVDAKTGHPSDLATRRYASDYVNGESIGSAGSTVYPGTLVRKPVIAATLIITDGVETFTDNGSGVLVSDASGGTNGTINYTTGVYSVTFQTTTITAPSATYRFNVERDTDGIASINIEVTSENVDSQVFPLKLEYSIFSAIALQKLHGMVLADEGMKFATQEIRFAIDEIVLDTIKTAATSVTGASGPGNFDVTVATGQEYFFRKEEVKRYFSKASANIFAKTLRASGNVIVGGINVCALVEGLQEYKPAANIGTKPPSGPYVHGTLGNKLVICNPFYDADEYVVLFRGDNYLFAGIIYAPYVPLYATNPVELADLTSQRGFYSQAAIKRINDGMFSRGTITNF